MDKPFPAYQGDEAYVFACYAHDDSDVVYPEMVWLREQRINLWYDEGISAGREWTQQLADAIQGCEQFLYFISPASVESRHCRNEVQYALERDKPVVSVYLEPTDLPGGLQLSIGLTQALMRYEICLDDYREKLQSVVSGPMDAKAASMETGPSRARSVLHRISKPAIGVALVAAVLFIGTTAVNFVERQENIRWAKEEALPEIERLIETGWRDFTDAYALATEAQRYIPDDPRLEQLLVMSSLGASTGGVSEGCC